MYISIAGTLFRKTKKFLLASFFVIGTLFTILNAYAYFSNMNSSPSSHNQITAADIGRAKIEKFMESTGDTPEGKLTQSMSAGILCSITGEACSYLENGPSRDEAFNQSYMGGVTKLLVAPYNYPPASGVEYIAYKMDSGGFLPQAYAYEGIGFSGLKPYIHMWEMFRNFSYLILVIIMVVIGFMIMFRMHINPQTVVSLENAIPRIIVTLILITFSFAIVGFVIDLLYASMAVITYLITDQMQQAKLSILNNNTPAGYVNTYLTAGFYDILPDEGWSNSFSAGKALVQILPTGLRGGISLVLGPIMGGILADWFAKPISWMTDLLKGVAGSFEGSILGFGGGAGIGAGGVPGIPAVLVKYALLAVFAFFIVPFLVGLAVMFTMLFFLFRIFFMLLFHYIKLLLLLIFAPIILLFHVIPGTSVYSWWWRSVLSQAITFPFFAMFALIGTALIEINQLGAATGGFRLPFLYNISPDKFGILLGMGLIFITPDLIKMIKGLIGLPDMAPIFGIGTFFGGAAAAMGGVSSISQPFSSLASVPGLQGLRKSMIGQHLAPQTTTEAINELSRGLGIKPKDDGNKSSK